MIFLLISGLAKENQAPNNDPMQNFPITYRLDFNSQKYRQLVFVSNHFFGKKNFGKFVILQKNKSFKYSTSPKIRRCSFILLLENKLIV